MTKIEEYNILKKENPNIVYLFKQGIFYRALNEDAELLNSKFGLKLLDSGFGYIQCGFPVGSITSYVEKFEKNKIKYKFIDKKVEGNTTKEYLHNIQCIEILKEIGKMDLDKMSPMNAHSKLQEFKNKLNS